MSTTGGRITKRTSGRVHRDPGDRFSPTPSASEGAAGSDGGSLPNTASSQRGNRLSAITRGAASIGSGGGWGGKRGVKSVGIAVGFPDGHHASNDCSGNNAGAVVVADGDYELGVVASGCRAAGEDQTVREGSMSASTTTTTTTPPRVRRPRPPGADKDLTRWRLACYCCRRCHRTSQGWQKDVRCGGRGGGRGWHDWGKICVRMNHHPVHVTVY